MFKLSYVGSAPAIGPGEWHVAAKAIIVANLTVVVYLWQ